MSCHVQYSGYILWYKCKVGIWYIHHSLSHSTYTSVLKLEEKWRHNILGQNVLIMEEKVINKQQELKERFKRLKENKKGGGGGLEGC